MKTSRLTRAEIERRLNQAYDEVIEACGLSDISKEAKKALAGTKPTKISSEKLLIGGVTMTVRMLMENRGRALMKIAPIRTEEDLQRTIQAIKQRGETLPTAIRQSAKAFKQILPRRGGPGARRKLTPKQESQACDHIAAFIRQKYSVKEALAKVSEMSPTLFGKKVGARTLQKAWDNRDSLPA